MAIKMPKNLTIILQTTLDNGVRITVFRVRTQFNGYMIRVENRVDTDLPYMHKTRNLRRSLKEVIDKFG